MRVGIIGGGSVGLLVSTYLYRTHHITLYVRNPQQKRVINNYGVWLDQGTLTYPKASFPDELHQEDCLVICVKQYQLEEVMSVLTACNIQTPVIFLQNGMGHVDQLHKLKSPVMLGTVEHGAKKLGDNLVSHTGHGCIKLASYNMEDNHLETLIAKLHQDGFPIRFQADWKTMLGEKLVVNAVINPLTALFGETNGAIVENSYIRTLAETLCHEACQVLDFSPNDQWEKVKKTASNTADNISSMLKDIREQRLTEIDAITGFLVRHASAPVPYTTFVYHGVKALEVKGDRKIKDDC